MRTETNCTLVYCFILVLLHRVLRVGVFNSREDGIRTIIEELLKPYGPLTHPGVDFGKISVKPFLGSFFLLPSLLHLPKPFFCALLYFRLWKISTVAVSLRTAERLSCTIKRRASSSSRFKQNRASMKAALDQQLVRHVLSPYLLGSSRLFQKISGKVETPLYLELLRSKGNDGVEGTADANIVVVLHGVLGSGKNLRTFSQMLIDQAMKRSGKVWEAALLDLRCHGQSTGRPTLSPPHTISAAATDVAQTVQIMWPNKRLAGLIGHSLGGKVALLAASQLHPASVWTLDSWPFKDDGTGGLSSDVQRVLSIVEKVPVPLDNREQLYTLLNERGLRSKVLQQWLGSSLKPQRSLRNRLHHEDGEKEKYDWMFDVAGIREMYSNYLEIDTSGILSSGKLNVHVVIAGKNENWSQSALKRIEDAASASQGKTTMHTCPNVGHWLHSENPKGVADLIAPHLVDDYASSTPEEGSNLS